MIKLANASQTTMWTSQTWSHPPQSGGTFLPYTLTHNKGRVPDLTRLYVKGDNGNWHECEGNQSGYGVQYDNTGSTANSVIAFVYRMNNGNYHDIYFKCYWFN